MRRVRPLKKLPQGNILFELTIQISDMPVLEPKWVIPVCSPVVDGVITDEEIIVLTNEKVFFFEKCTRRLLNSFGVTFGDGNSLS